MKVAFRVLMIGLFAAQLSGCAVLGLTDSDAPDPSDDPVAAAALNLRGRTPASESPFAPAPIAPPSDDAPNDQLILGMSRSNVHSLWGTPAAIEVAGDNSDGNERWVYQNGLKSSWGTSDVRIVYFEGGRVAGWENHR